MFPSLFGIVRINLQHIEWTKEERTKFKSFCLFRKTSRETVVLKYRSLTDSKWAFDSNTVPVFILSCSARRCLYSQVRVSFFQRLWIIQITACECTEISRVSVVRLMCCLYASYLCCKLFEEFGQLNICCLRFWDPSKQRIKWTSQDFFSYLLVLFINPSHKNISLERKHKYN